MDGHERALAREREHLARIVGIARAQLLLAERDEARQGAQLSESRRELRDEAQRQFGNLWGSEDFEALLNLNQFQQPLSVQEAARSARLERIQTLRSMLDAPYFARIDFAFDDGDIEEVYIGRATLRDEQTHEIYVHDWRSPVASLFYRFGTGRAHYDAPGGRIEGAVTLKRQFEIRRGELLYFFDAEAEVRDGFLRGMLSQNASPRMKAIVETLQRDQDAVIRDTGHELVMVQGAAGSGKSSIALHRVAYLMYEGLAAPLQARDVLILSPNALFERYIRGVLPELGESSVATATLEQLLSQVLGGAPVESRGERFERLSGMAPAGRALARERMAFRSSQGFIALMDRFARELPRRWIGFQDVCYGGETVATRQRLKERAMREEAAPLGVRLARMERSLWDGIHQRKPARMARLVQYARRDPRHALEIPACARAYSILESWALSRHIRAFTRLDPLALYRRLMWDEAAVRRLGRGLELPEDLPDLLRCAETAPGGALPPEDAAAAAYLALRIEGAGRWPRIRQVVVDEAQDYDPMQYQVLNLLFPRARFTVLGDVNQALDRRVDRALYDQIEAILDRRSVQRVELNKSFRCTREILEFSLMFLEGPDKIESFNRSGDAPGEYAAGSIEEMVQMIAAEAALCREKGMQSVALIARTQRDAREWRAHLAAAMDIALIDPEGAGETTGAFVIPLQLSKGLEFDAVLVLDADRYEEGGDRRLLYVACTRALHRLNLYRLGAGAEGGENA